MSSLRVTSLRGRTAGSSPTLPDGVVITGVATATSFSGNVTGVDATFSGNVSIGGTLTYEDVTNIDSVGLITARTGIQVLAGGINAVGVVTGTSFSGSGSGLTGVSTNFVSAIGIQSGGTVIGAGITQLNFIGAGNTFAVNGTTVDISIQGGGGGGGTSLDITSSLFI